MWHPCGRYKKSDAGNLYFCIFGHFTGCPKWKIDIYSIFLIFLLIFRSVKSEKIEISKFPASFFLNDATYQIWGQFDILKLGHHRSLNVTVFGPRLKTEGSIKSVLFVCPSVKAYLKNHSNNFSDFGMKLGIQGSIVTETLFL